MWIDSLTQPPLYVYTLCKEHVIMFILHVPKSSLGITNTAAQWTNQALPMCTSQNNGVSLML